MLSRGVSAWLLVLLTGVEVEILILGFCCFAGDGAEATDPAGRFLLLTARLLNIDEL